MLGIKLRLTVVCKISILFYYPSSPGAAFLCVSQPPPHQLQVGRVVLHNSEQTKVCVPDPFLTFCSYNLFAFLFCAFYCPVKMDEGVIHDFSPPSLFFAYSSPWLLFPSQNSTSQYRVNFNCYTNHPNFLYNYHPQLALGDASDLSSSNQNKP